MIESLGSARMAENQRYRITDKIDAGGMAEVYRGVAESAVGGLKKSVAIKRILPNLTKNKKFVSMFLDEARVSMHLQHANIVGVFDIGMAETAYFMEKGEIRFAGTAHELASRDDLVRSAFLGRRAP